MKLTYNELVKFLGKKAIEKLFTYGHPTAWVTYRVANRYVEWQPTVGKFYVSSFNIV